VRPEPPRGARPCRREQRAILRTTHLRKSPDGRAARYERAKNDGFGIQIKLRHQIADQPCTHERMIDRAENDPFGFRSPQGCGSPAQMDDSWPCSQRGFTTTKEVSSFAIVRISSALAPSTTRVTPMPRVSRDLNQMFEKMFPSR